MSSAVVTLANLHVKLVMLEVSSCSGDLVLQIYNEVQDTGMPAHTLLPRKVQDKMLPAAVYCISTEQQSTQSFAMCSFALWGAPQNKGGTVLPACGAF